MASAYGARQTSKLLNASGSTVLHSPRAEGAVLPQRAAAYPYDRKVGMAKRPHASKQKCPASWRRVRHR